MNWFCTHFDTGYLPQGRALHQSLMQHGGDFTLIILCLDVEVEERLRALQLANVHLVPLGLLETSDTRLLAAKAERRKAEYYFTLKPCLCRHIFDATPDVDFLTYVDSDVFFFGSCDPWVAEMRGSDAVVVPHRFPAHSAWRERFGRFNAGCVAFRRSEAGLAALTWWHERCLEWCHDVPDGDRFADQKYLDHLADHFAGVLALDHPGVNLAPWNLQDEELSVAGDQVWVKGRPLVFYHFSGVQRQSRHVFDVGLGEYGSALGPLSREHIFVPYFKVIVALTADRAIASNNKKRNTDSRSLSSIVIINPSLGGAASADSMTAYAAELEDVLLAVEERNNRTLLAFDADVRALDAGGLWLRETARQAERHWKQSAKRTAELEKALSAKATRKGGMKGWLAGIFTGSSKGSSQPAPSAPSDSLSWPPSPDQIIAQSSPGQFEEATSTSPSLPPGACLIAHCSVRTVGYAARLAVKGHQCVVLGCPGWLKKGSTAKLSFAMESLANQLAQSPHYLADYSAVLVDFSDRAWAQALLDAAAFPREKVYFLGLGPAYELGLDFDSVIRQLEPPAAK
jgi:hypothetical protein